MATMASIDIQHLDREQLEASLAHIRASPAEGTLELIVQRPAVDERVVLDEARLTCEEGLEGDSWNQRSSKRTDDGSPHPDMQLNIMNSRILGAIARSPERMPLAGDQLIVDMDLSEANLPPWTKLAIGEAVAHLNYLYTRGALQRSVDGAGITRFVAAGERAGDPYPVSVE